MIFKDIETSTPFDDMWDFARLLIACMAIISITGICMWLMVYENKGIERDIRCINAACEKPCVEGQKLKRHEGCK